MVAVWGGQSAGTAPGAGGEKREREPRGFRFGDSESLSRGMSLNPSPSSG
jgi:hypothetical protein